MAIDPTTFDPLAVSSNTFAPLPVSTSAELPLNPDEPGALLQRSEFGKGLRSGMSSLGGTTDAALATFLSRPGEPYYTENMASARRQMGEASAAAPRLQKVTDVRGLRDALDWAGGAAGQALASSAPSLLAGLAGGPLGVGRAAFAGRVAAGTVGAFLPEAGETVLEAPANAPFEEVRKAAALRGTANAALESLVPAAIPGQTAKAFVRGARSGVQSALGVGLRDIVGEAATEAAQDYTGQMADAYLRTGVFTFTSPDFDKLLNAAAAGAVGGGVLGAVPVAANLAAGALQQAVPSAETVQTGVDKAKSLYGRLTDRSPVDLMNEGEFLGGRDAVPPEIAAQGTQAIYDSLTEADQRRTDLARERLGELLVLGDLSDEQRTKLEGFRDREHSAAVQRQIAEAYYPNKVEEAVRTVKGRAIAGIKSFFGARKQNLQTIGLQDAVDRTFEEVAPHLDEESRNAMLTFVAESMRQPGLVIPITAAKDKSTLTLIDRLAGVLTKFGYAPRGLARGEVKKAAEDATARGERMSKTLELAVARALSPEMKEMIDPTDAANFVQDYIVFGPKDPEGSEILMKAMFGDRAPQIMKLARNLGFTRADRLAMAQADRFAPQLEEERSQGADTNEGLTETDKGLIYDVGEQPFSRGSASYRKITTAMRATKTPYRVRTYRDVLERAGLSETEVVQALKDAKIKDPVVLDTTLEDEAFSDEELDSIIWDPEKGDPEGESVFTVTNAEGEEVKVSAVALVNTVARRYGTQSRSKSRTVGELFGEGLSLLASDPRVGNLDMAFKDDLLVQIRPMKFTWKDIKSYGTSLSAKDQEAAKEIGVSQVHSLRSAVQRRVDKHVEKILENLDDTKNVDAAEEAIQAMEATLETTRPAKDAEQDERVMYRARTAAVRQGVKEIEREIERVNKGREEDFDAPRETLSEQTKKGVREWQEESRLPLIPANAQLTAMQRAVVKAVIGKRIGYAKSKKQIGRAVPFTIPVVDQHMLEMALSESTPIQIQRLMFAAFDPKKQQMADLKGKTFAYDAETHRYTLKAAKAGDKPAVQSLEDAYKKFKQVNSKEPLPAPKKVDTSLQTRHGIRPTRVLVATDDEFREEMMPVFVLATELSLGKEFAEFAEAYKAYADTVRAETYDIKERDRAIRALDALGGQIDHRIPKGRKKEARAALERLFNLYGGFTAVIDRKQLTEAEVLIKKLLGSVPKVVVSESSYHGSERLTDGVIREIVAISRKYGGTTPEGRKRLARGIYHEAMHGLMIRIAAESPDLYGKLLTAAKAELPTLKAYFSAQKHQMHRYYYAEANPEEAVTTLFELWATGDITLKGKVVQTNTIRAFFDWFKQLLDRMISPKAKDEDVLAFVFQAFKEQGVGPTLEGITLEKLIEARDKTWGSAIRYESSLEPLEAQRWEYAREKMRQAIAQGRVKEELLDEAAKKELAHLMNPDFRSMDVGGYILAMHNFHALMRGEHPSIRKLNKQAASLAQEIGAGGIPATHDSPHRFEKFDWRNHIGRGEGHQAFGPGNYFSTREGTHRSYKDALGRHTPSPNVDVYYKGKKVNVRPHKDFERRPVLEDVANSIAYRAGDVKQGLKDALFSDNHNRNDDIYRAIDKLKDYTYPSPIDTLLSSTEIEDLSLEEIAQRVREATKDDNEPRIYWVSNASDEAAPMYVSRATVGPYGFDVIDGDLHIGINDAGAFSTTKFSAKEFAKAKEIIKKYGMPEVDFVKEGSNSFVLTSDAFHANEEEYDTVVKAWLDALAPNWQRDRQPAQFKAQDAARTQIRVIENNFWEPRVKELKALRSEDFSVDVKGKFGAGRAATYEVVLKTEGDNLIDWDVPLTKQPEKVKKVVSKLLEQPKEKAKDFKWRGTTLVDNQGKEYGHYYKTDRGDFMSRSEDDTFIGIFLTAEDAKKAVQYVAQQRREEISFPYWDGDAYIGVSGKVIGRYKEQDIQGRKSVYAYFNNTLIGTYPNVLVAKQIIESTAKRKANSGLTGREILDSLSSKLGSELDAIDALLKEGIVGHRYLEAVSRRSGDGYYNYVIWNDDIIEPMYVWFNRQDPGHYDLTPEDQKEIREYVDRVLGPKTKVVFEAAGVELGSYGEDEIRLLLRTRNQKDVHYHEAMHAFIERMSGRDKEALLAAARSAPMLTKLRELIGNDPAALEQLKDPEEAAAYLYQFWASGALKVGPRTETIFQKILKAIRGFFDVLSQDERAELIMQYFHEGRFRNKWFETERSFTERQLQKFESFLNAANDIADKVAFTAQSRMRESGIPALNDIADAMRPNEGEGYIARKFRTTNKYITRLNEILRGVSEEELSQAVKVLRFETKPEDASPAVQRVVRDTRALLEEMNQYLRVQGVKRLEWVKDHWEEKDPGYIKNYFPRVWDTNKLLKEKEQFIDMLRKKYPEQVKSRDAAEDIYGHLVASSGEGELTDPNTAYSPFQRAVNVRSLAFFKGEDIAPWLESDYVNIMSTYLSQAVRRGEYTKRFGAQGQWLRGKILEAAEQGATKEQIDTGIKYIRAVDGTLGYEKLDPRWQRLMGGMTVYQNIRLLPFAIFSSLVDPLGLALRSNSIGAAWKGMKRGFAGMADVARKEDEKDAAYKLAEKIGTIESKGMMEALGQMYSSMYLRGWPKKLNDMMFKYNLMDGWNRQMRIAATEVGIDFIEKHLAHPNEHSERYLKELGLKPEDRETFIKPDGGLKLFVEDGLDGPDADRINAAVMKFVDGSVLRPDATQRPIWASDPRWTFLFHLKQFSYSFYETIVKRGMNEAKEGNFFPLYVLGSYVPFMMAADFAKDMLLNGGEPPEWKKDWGPTSYVWYGVERAGLFGPSQYLIDVGEFGPESLFGPAVEQIANTLQNPATGLKKALPFHQVLT